MIVMIALFKSFLVELVCFRFYLKSFFLDGHGTKYKKCMGTQNPRFFPLMGTVPSTKYCWAPGSCPSLKILSKSVRHGSLGAMCRTLKVNYAMHPSSIRIFVLLHMARRGAGVK